LNFAIKEQRLALDSLEPLSDIAMRNPLNPKPKLSRNHGTHLLYMDNPSPPSQADLYEIICMSYNDDNGP